MTIKTGQDLPAWAEGDPGRRVRRLSFAQEQLWFLDQLAPGEALYNVLMAWRLHGPLRVDLLQRSLNLVVARHESLRVTIRSAAGTPYQVVAPPAEVPLPVTDLRTLASTECEQRVRAAIEAQRAEPYDLQTGPLCRFRLLRLDAEEYVFCQAFHHIITDGWSVAVINAELSAAYRSLCSGAQPAFADAELDYTEFAESQRERLQGGVLADELAFWQRRLADLPVLELPADRPRPAGGTHRGETLIRDFSDDLRGIVKQLADDHGASMFMVLAAAYNLVLSRHGGLEDIPTGVPMLGRPEPELEAVVGMFINMVVLRSDLSGDPTFSELIDRIADGILDLYEHQEVSFSQVVDAVQPVRDPDRNPLFQISVQLLDESTSGENLSLPGMIAEYMPLASAGSRFDISINVIDSGSSLRAAVEYSSDMFARWRMEAMLTHLETVLRAVVADPGRRLSQIPIVAGAEAEQLISAGRDQVVRYGRQPAGQVYVVDRSMNLVPRGVAGELLISCEPGNLADGGHPDQPELTAGKFIADPFRPGRLVYRSGDLVRWNADLRIEFLDQVRSQVELGEIEAALASHPDVGQAVALVRPGQSGEQRLIGYVTPAAGREPVPEELRAYLAGTLPDHMIPAIWVVLDEFPLVAGGMPDRDALPDPAEAGTGTGTGEDGSDEPRTHTEQTVAGIFGEVLTLPGVDVESDFFSIGGNSLQAMRAVSRINKAFGIKLSVRTLYGNSTVRAVSGAVDKTTDDEPA